MMSRMRHQKKHDFLIDFFVRKSEVLKELNLPKCFIINFSLVLTDYVEIKKNHENGLCLKRERNKLRLPIIVFRSDELYCSMVEFDVMDSVVSHINQYLVIYNN